jgi:tetratricopeptide (TPR) repeat protein
MASNPLAVPILVGLGIEELSGTAGAVPVVKEIVRALDSSEAAQDARRALEAGTADEVHAIAAERLRAAGLLDHPDIGYARLVLGKALIAERRPAEALVELEAVVANWELKLGRQYPDLADPLMSIGRAHLLLNAPKKAVPPLERALALMGDTWPDTNDPAEVQLYLASIRPGR